MREFEIFFIKIVIFLYIEVKLVLSLYVHEAVNDVLSSLGLHDA